MVGKIFPEGNKEGTMIELDVVAESFDKKHILIGECKWTNKEDAQRLARTLSEKLPIFRLSKTVKKYISSFF